MGDSDIKKEVEKQKEPQKTEKTAKKKAGFFRSLKAEFKRIIWPDKATIIRQTVVVVVITIIVGVLISLIDSVVQLGLDAIIGR